MRKYVCTEETFLMDVKDHKLNIIFDEGSRRHIRFKKTGSIDMYFDLITWPGCLCYTGDMGSYVFQRLEDMFDFFRTKPETYKGLYINPGYWGEKLLSIDKYSGFTEFSNEKFHINVLEYLNAREASQEIKEDAIAGILSEDYDNEYQAYKEVNEYRYEGFTFKDFFEYDCTEYTYRFIWCCYALAWGINKYDEYKINAINLTTATGIVLP